MRRSSRITIFFSVAVLLTPTAQAGGLVARGSGIGGARGLSPLRPIVGTARGLSPIRPVVGAARGLPPTAVDVGRRGERPWRRRFAPGYGFYGDSGLGYLGSGPTDPLDSGATGIDPAPDRGAMDPYPIIMAPPRPCVSPQIIKIGKPGRIERRAVRVSQVRVIYGLPGCARF